MAVNKNPVKAALMMYFWQPLVALLSKSSTTHNPGLSFTREFGNYNSSTDRTPCTPECTSRLSNKQKKPLLISRVSCWFPISPPGFATSRGAAGMCKPLSSTGSSLFCLAFQDLGSVLQGKSSTAVPKHNFVPSVRERAALQLLMCHHRQLSWTHSLQWRLRQTCRGILVLLFGDVNQDRWCKSELWLCHGGRAALAGGDVPTAPSESHPCCSTRRTCRTRGNVPAGLLRGVQLLLWLLADAFLLYIQLSLTPARMEISLFPRTDSREL